MDALRRLVNSARLCPVGISYSYTKHYILKLHIGSAPFKSAGVKVIGISADAPKKQKAFVEKYNLNVRIHACFKGIKPLTTM